VRRQTDIPWLHCTCRHIYQKDSLGLRASDRPIITWTDSIRGKWYGWDDKVPRTGDCIFKAHDIVFHPWRYRRRQQLSIYDLELKVPKTNTQASLHAHVARLDHQRLQGISRHASTDLHTGISIGRRNISNPRMLQMYHSDLWCAHVLELEHCFLCLQYGSSSTSETVRNPCRFGCLPHKIRVLGYVELDQFPFPLTTTAITLYGYRKGLNLTRLLYGMLTGDFYTPVA
jgi:hypothetical protein